MYIFVEVVGLLLERGANINDPGGRACEGVTPLHDTLNCGHFSVARILIQRGAAVTVRNGKVRRGHILDICYTRIPEFVHICITYSC